MHCDLSHDLRLECYFTNTSLPTWPGILYVLLELRDVEVALLAAALKLLRYAHLRRDIETLEGNPRSLLHLQACINSGLQIQATFLENTESYQCTQILPRALVT